jgi:SulP family sulfate permease
VFALVMVFYTQQLVSLPSAALAGVVASAVLSLIEVGELRELWRMRRSEFRVVAVCLVSLLVPGPLKAVIVAFLPATIDLLRRVSRPGTWVLQESPDGSHLIPEETGHISNQAGIIVYRLGAPLYFANATLFEEEVENLVTQAEAPVKWFVLDAEAADLKDKGHHGMIEYGVEVIYLTLAFALQDRPGEGWAGYYSCFVWQRVVR